MKLAAGFFVLLLISGISAASAASIISIELDSDTLVVGEIVEITGTVEGSLAGKPVGIEIKDSDGDIILIRAITSDSNGNFTLKFKVPSSASGDIEIVSSVEIDGQSFSGSVSATVSSPELFDAEPEVEPEAEPEPEAELEPEAESEPIAQQVAESEVKSQTSEGCGEGTVMVNGVCQLAPTQSITSFMSIEPIYLIIGAVAIGGGAIGAIFAIKRGSGTPKPKRQDLDEYESRYVSKQKRKPTSRRPAKKEETSSSCSNCGASLNPKAKFCGSCGNRI